MSDQENQSIGVPAPEVTSLSQLQRVTNTFTAPSKTFEDIKRGNKSWWLPFIILMIASYILFAAITIKVTWPQVAENSIHLSPKGEDRMAQASPAQRETSMKWTQYAMEGAFAASPILVLVYCNYHYAGVVGHNQFRVRRQSNIRKCICRVDVCGPCLGSSKRCWGL